MSPRVRRPARAVFVLAAVFYSGLALGWWLHAAFGPAAGASAPPQSGTSQIEVQPHDAGENLRGSDIIAPERDRVATSGELPPRINRDPIAELRRRTLRFPIQGAEVGLLEGHFAQPRDRGGRIHQAVDVLAPRHTPVHAADEGTIARLMTNAGAGLSIYQFDSSRGYCYFYAHLQQYASGLREGKPVQRGEVIGYVGTTGNAPPDTPHLHFAIYAVEAGARRCSGAAIDPYLVFRLR